MKSATKFRWVKTSSGKVVEQSVSYVYKINEKYRTESVSFHLKYWVKVTYPVTASTSLLARGTLSALPDDVMCKIECGQLHSERFGLDTTRWSRTVFLRSLSTCTRVVR